MSVGQAIQKLRRKVGLSQSELAKKAGVPTSTLQAWEQSRRSPRLDALLKLARALDVSLDELAGQKSSRKGRRHAR
jgi:transcriptional regulator with XRE-family HTH domain